jgi:hypothetical protein
MKKLWVVLCLGLAAVVTARAEAVKAAVPTGSVQVTVNYQKMAFQTTWYFVWFYDTTWNPVAPFGPMGPMGGGPLLIENVPAGDYYIKVSVWLDECRAGTSEYRPCNDPYIPEYYDNSLTQGGAVKIHVSASMTTVLNPVWIETDFYICVTTNPNAHNVYVDGIRRMAPAYLAWRAGETHTIGADARIDVQDGARYDFREWKHGGPREQSFKIPAGTKKDTLVARYTLMYRLDIASSHGTPRGGGWGRAWRDTLIGVEPSVVEKIPPNAFPAKALVRADTDSVRYVFERWEGFGAGSYSGTDNPATVTMNFTITETAFWKTRFRLDVQVADTSMGAVSVNPPGLWQDRGDTVALRAVPKPGYAFSGWEGSIFGTAETGSLIMDTTKTVFAKFVRSVHPPVIAIPDTSFAEDDTLCFSNSELGSWISDPRDPMKNLTVRVESRSGRLHAEMDIAKICVWADPDWNGTGWAVIRVTDPEGSSSTDTVRIHVTPVDDPPDPFDLVSPPEDSEIADSTEALKFVWGASRNRDAANGDTIAYSFCFGRQGGNLDTLSVTADTSFVLPGTSFPGNGVYRWKVLARDRARNAVWSESERKLTVAVQSGITDRGRIPLKYDLSRNYPNPFNPSTEIVYALPERARVRIEIFTPVGKRIRTLADLDRPAGEYTIAWDGADDSGRKAGSGIYVCRMTAGRFSKAVKMMVVK